MGKRGPKPKYTPKEKLALRRLTYRRCASKRYKEKYEAVRLIAKKAGIKYRYGITHEFVEKERERQGNKCLICSEEDRKLVIDHDHDTGKYRGLVCFRCNTALGLIHDDIELLEKLGDYLVRSRNE